VAATRHPRGEVVLVPGVNELSDDVGAQVLANATAEVRAGLLYEVKE